jgi:hypothetical protein
MCLAFMFTEIGNLTIREEGQGDTRKVKPHNNQPKHNVQAVMSTLASMCATDRTGHDTNWART